MLWKYPEDDPLRLSPLILAYIGDAVFELYIRSRLAADRAKLNRIHREAIKMVSARAMADYYLRLEPSLTAVESDVLRRGRNVKTRKIKSAGVIQYHMSTGFEALVGYLFLSRQEDRLEQLLKLLMEVEDGAAESKVD